MVEKKDIWTFQGKKFKHCPKCEKGIPADFTSHKCGWGLTPEQMEEFHIGDKFLKQPIKEVVKEEKIEENKFWKTKIETFVGLTAVKLSESLNEFGKDHWVIATQIFPMELNNKRYYDAFVYYKVNPEVKNE